jgi:hypothetical protein
MVAAIGEDLRGEWEHRLRPLVENQGAITGKPSVSTRMWCLTPLVFLPSS